MGYVRPRRFEKLRRMPWVYKQRYILGGKLERAEGKKNRPSFRELCVRVSNVSHLGIFSGCLTQGRSSSDRIKGHQHWCS